MNTFPGEPTFYMDSDRTVDVNLPDRYGRTMFTYRAREGHPWGDKINYPKKDSRHTGLLRPNGGPSPISTSQNR